MNIPSYLIANTLNLSVAQRLVRLLCPDCKEEIERGCGDESLEQYLDEDVGCYAVAVGCKKCFYTGYKGRKAVYELIPVDNEVRYCIKKGGEEADELLKSKGVVFLKDYMMHLVREKQTSPEEIVSYLII